MASASLPAYEVDTSQWPIVTMRPTVAVSDMAALDLTYAKMDAVVAMVARNETVGVVLDLRGVVSNAKRRKRFNDWIALNGVAIRRHVVGAAVIASSTVERGIVTAAVWLLAPPIPMRVFSQPGDAEAWLRQMYAARVEQSAERAR